MTAGKINSILIILSAVTLSQFVAYTMFHIPPQLEMLLIAVTVLAYPVIRYPLFGVYAVFVLGVFTNHFRRLYYLVYERPGVDPLLVLTDAIIGLTFLGLYFEFKKHRTASLPGGFHSRLVTGYLIYLTVRVFVYNALPLPVALTNFKHYGPAVLAFFVGRYYAARKTHLKALWTMTAALAVVTALYGLKQLYLGFSEAEKIWIANVPFVSLFVGNLVRPFSFFQAPVLYADYLQIGVVSVLILSDNKLRWTWFPVLTLCGLFGWAMLTTSVRSSWIGLAITIPLWYGLVGIRGAGRRCIVAGVIAVAIALVHAFGAGERTSSSDISRMISRSRDATVSHFDVLVTHRADAVTDPFQEHSFKSRMRLWGQIIHLANEPFMAILGRGVGTLKADSLYVTYLAELGFPGLFLMIFILAAFISRGFSVIDKTGDPAHRSLAKGITVLNIVFAIIGITGTHIHTFPGDFYFWFWNGVLVALPLPTRQQSIDPILTTTALQEQRR